MLDISLIVPIYKKERIVKKSIEKLFEVLYEHDIKFEIIAVIDGSPDKSYNEILKICNKDLKVINLQKNIGKGGAIKEGALIAKGNYIGVLDCGLDINPRSLDYYIEPIKQGKYPIITASKYHPDSIMISNVKRKILSRMFISLKDYLFNIGINDTQIGLKFFNAKAFKLITPFLNENRWLWDIEVFIWFKKMYIQPILELPVILNMVTKDESSESSKLITIFKIFIQMFYLSFKLGKIGEFLNSGDSLKMKSFINNTKF